ncbi:MAG: Ribonuclease, partial [Candidatus Parcubacteria bacterium]|nr:Ribonuclease [Candidatus Parcubacteria bacterium]
MSSRAAAAKAANASPFNMLRRSQRLSVGQFKEIMEKGRIAHSSLFVARTLRAEAVDSGARLSAVAPQRVAPTAVARNKMRRKMYEAVHSIYPSLK